MRILRAIDTILLLQYNLILSLFFFFSNIVLKASGETSLAFTLDTPGLGATSNFKRYTITAETKLPLSMYVIIMSLLSHSNGCDKISTLTQKTLCMVARKATI